MLLHSLERRKSPGQILGQLAAKSQQNSLEGLFRDRDPMQYDPPWPGQTIAIMFLHFMYEMKTSETLFNKVSTGKLNLLPGSIDPMVLN